MSSTRAKRRQGQKAFHRDYCFVIFVERESRRRTYVRTESWLTRAHAPIFGLLFLLSQWRRQRAFFAAAAIAVTC